MRKKYTEKGFTLIELLVVVAIIGILSTLVLSSLSKARTRSQYAQAKAEMTQLRNQAEIYVTGAGSYSSSSITVCPTSSSTSPNNVFESEQFFAIMSNLAEMEGITNFTDVNSIYCTSTEPDKYAFAIRMNRFLDVQKHDDGSDYADGLILCVDYAGKFTIFESGIAEEFYDDCIEDDTTI